MSIWSPAVTKKTIKTGINAIKNENIAAYYDKLALIIKGPIFSGARFAAIWNMNMGKYDHLIDYEKCRFSYMKRLKLAQINTPKKEGTKSKGPEIYSVNRNGMLLTLDSKRHDNLLEINADHKENFVLTLLDGSSELQRFIVSARLIAKDGDILSLRYVKIPKKIAQKGYNRIAIFPFVEDKTCHIGHIRLLLSYE